MTKIRRALIAVGVIALAAGCSSAPVASRQPTGAAYRACKWDGKLLSSTSFLQAERDSARVLTIVGTKNAGSKGHPPIQWAHFEADARAQLLMVESHRALWATGWPRPLPFDETDTTIRVLRDCQVLDPG